MPPRGRQRLQSQTSLQHQSQYQYQYRDQDGRDEPESHSALVHLNPAEILGLGPMSVFLQRNQEDRQFLHSFANCMAVLKYALLAAEKRMAHPDQNQTPASDEALRLATLFTRATDAMNRMERTHADFKLVVYSREIEDGNEPLKEQPLSKKLKDF